MSTDIVVDEPLREKATEVAVALTGQAFEDCPPYQRTRELTREELERYFITAFELGSQWEARR